MRIWDFVVRWTVACATASLLAACGGGSEAVATADAPAAKSASVSRFVQPDGSWRDHDADGTGGEVYRLYQAAFGRVADPAGLGYQIAAMEVDGLTLADLAGNFMASPEFQHKYGVLGDAQFVQALYANVLGRAPDADGLHYHLSNLAGGTSRSQVLVNFAQSPENRERTADALAEGIVYRTYLKPKAQGPAFRNMRAVHMGANWENNRTSARSAEAVATWIDELQRRNVNWVGISMSLFLDSGQDPAVRVRYQPVDEPADAPPTAWTFDDADLIALIGALRTRGMHVYLTLALDQAPPGREVGGPCGSPGYLGHRSSLGYPDVYVANPGERCVDPAHWWWNPAHPQHHANVATFWRTYTEAAVKYGRIAQEHGVELYSLGTETEGLFRTRPGGPWQNDFSVQLRELVAAVRSVYQGPVTYDQVSDALLVPSYFGAQQLLFADLDLDAVGVSAYFHLTDDVRPYTTSELREMWARLFDATLLPLRDRHPGKPVLFLEFGYTDDLRAVAQPSAGEGEPEGPGVTPGMIQQQNILQAFFEVNESRGRPVQATFLWDNQITTPVQPRCSRKGFMQFCRPAAETVGAEYGRLKAAP